jgi:hypothetical protein
MTHLLAHLFVLVLPHLLTPLLNNAAHILNSLLTLSQNERPVG